MTKSNLLKTLQIMNTRVTEFNGLGANGDRAPGLKSAFASLLASMDPNDAGFVPDAERAKFIQEAWRDPAKMKELCELRVDAINNYIRATSNFLNFYFSEVSLGDGDVPEFLNETRSEINVGYISQEGKPRLVKAVNPQTRTAVPLRVISTDEVWYFLHDIYIGDVSATARASFDLGYDMTNKLDLNAYTLLTADLNDGGVFGDFVTSGTKQNRTYAANSRVITANLPTTNDLILSSTSSWPYPATANGSGAGRRFRMDVIQAIKAYCDRWANVFPDGPLAPTGLIIVPSIDASDLRSLVLPTGATNNPIANGLMQNYTRFEYLGTNWVIMPDVTLAAGACYAILNKSVGSWYTKRTSPLTFEDVKTDLRANKETRYQQQVAGFAIPSQRRPNALRIVYSDQSEWAS